MAEIKTIAVYNDDGVPIKREVGFNSKSILYYTETNSEKITAVVLIKDLVKELIYINMPIEKFRQKKIEADEADNKLYQYN